LCIRADFCESILAATLMADKILCSHKYA